jgi:hypothetical protein
MKGLIDVIVYIDFEHREQLEKLFYRLHGVSGQSNLLLTRGLQIKLLSM